METFKSISKVISRQIYPILKGYKVSWNWDIMAWWLYSLNNVFLFISWFLMLLFVSIIKWHICSMTYFVLDILAFLLFLSLKSHSFLWDKECSKRKLSGWLLYKRGKLEIRHYNATDLAEMSPLCSVYIYFFTSLH